MLRDFIIEVKEAIDELVLKAYETNPTSFLLLLARGDITEGLKRIVGTDCVTDYTGDLYRGETAEEFYLRYMNKNYGVDGFTYQGDDGLDALYIEMMIYSHLWASFHFLKSLYRFGSIFQGQDYPWKVDVQSRESGRWNWMNDNIITPFENASLKIANIIKKSYSIDIRDAFAHALFSINKERRIIHIYPKRINFTLTFEDFQQKFLYSVLLTNMLRGNMAELHNQYASLNRCLTKPFLTPEGVKCQLFGVLVQRGEKLNPEFRIKKVF